MLEKVIRKAVKDALGDTLASSLLDESATEIARLVAIEMLGNLSIEDKSSELSESEDPAPYGYKEDGTPYKRRPRKSKVKDPKASKNDLEDLGFDASEELKGIDEYQDSPNPIGDL